MNPLKAIWESLPYVVSAIIGITMGVCYALDGWRASPTATPLDKTIRLKNFIWVAGGALTTLAIDFKSLFPSSDRGALFTCYIFAWFLTAAGIILISAIAAAQDAKAFKKENPAGYPDRPFRPVSEYVLYGYEYYKKNYKEAVDNKLKSTLGLHRAWTKEYIEKLTYAVRQARKSRVSPDKKQEYALNVLTYICAVVTVYYKLEAKDVVITANYMIAYGASKKTPDPRFVDPKEPTHDRVLVVEGTSNESDQRYSILPVEKANALKSLPGAPLALITCEDQIEDNTEKIEYQRQLHTTVKKACIEFFEKRGYKSFASLLLYHPGTIEPFGVLNIESNVQAIFGSDNDAKQETKNMLRPFSILLETIITA
jgi:hypothetical protein